MANFPTTRFGCYSLLLLLLVASSGCFGSRELARVRYDIEHALPDARFQELGTITISSLTMDTADLIVRHVPQAEHYVPYLSDIDEITVSMYETLALPSVENMRLPISLREFQDMGWTILARVQEDKTAVWALTRERADILREMMVVVLDREMLVISNIRGRFDRMIYAAMRQMDNGAYDLWTDPEDWFDWDE